MDADVHQEVVDEPCRPVPVRAPRWTGRAPFRTRRSRCRIPGTPAQTGRCPWFFSSPPPAWRKRRTSSAAAALPLTAVGGEAGRTASRRRPPPGAANPGRRRCPDRAPVPSRPQAPRSSTDRRSRPASPSPTMAARRTCGGGTTLSRDLGGTPRSVLVPPANAASIAAFRSAQEAGHGTTSASGLAPSHCVHVCGRDDQLAACSTISTALVRARPSRRTAWSMGMPTSPRISRPTTSAAGKRSNARGREPVGCVLAFG